MGWIIPAFPVPSGGAYPYTRGVLATTLDFSRPAQRSTALLRPVGSCRVASKRPACLEGSGRFSLPPRAAPIATGWSDPVAGWDSHPQKISTFFTLHECDATQNTEFSMPDGRPASPILLNTCPHTTFRQFQRTTLPRSRAGSQARTRDPQAPHANSRRSDLRIGRASCAHNGHG